VAVETMMHAHNKIVPGTTMDEIVVLRKANPGGGPHSVTGPIYVEGAEPGDVMEVRIVKRQAEFTTWTRRTSGRASRKRGEAYPGAIVASIGASTTFW
jgi:acetamidase/formamidase